MYGMVVDTQCSTDEDVFMKKDDNDDDDPALARFSPLCICNGRRDVLYSPLGVYYNPRIIPYSAYPPLFIGSVVSSTGLGYGAAAQDQIR